MPDREFDQWIFEFRRLWGGSPKLSMATLAILLNQWHADVTPQEVVDALRGEKK
jgi:hypothetical protein